MVGAAKLFVPSVVATALLLAADVAHAESNIRAANTNPVSYIVTPWASDLCDPGGAHCTTNLSDAVDCKVDCQIYYNPWSASNTCNPETGLRTRARTQVAAFTAKNGGTACPPVQSETRKYLVNCKLQYSDWSTATCNKATGLQTRTQFQAFSAKNAGKARGAAQTQACPVDCEMKFPDWNPTIHLCDKTTSFRARTEIVAFEAKNKGKTCLTPAKDVLACPVDCETQFQPCDANLHLCDKNTGLRTRTQIPSVTAKNSGLECSVPRSDMQPCRVDCEVTFPDWNSILCTTTNTKTRAQYATIAVKNNGSPCKFKNPQVMICSYIQHSGMSSNTMTGDYGGPGDC